MAEYLVNFKSFDALTDKLDALNLAWGEVNEFRKEVYEQPSAKENEVLVDVTDEIGQVRKTVQSPYRFSKSASGVAPGTSIAKRGENNVAALQQWLGMDEAEISALTESKTLISE